MTEGNAVGRLVSEFGMLCPRQDVVNMKMAVPISAILACPVVAGEHGIAECDVKRIGPVCVPRRACAAFPPRMRRADQMLVLWRAAACALRSFADLAFVALGELAPLEGARVGLAGSIACERRHQPRLPAIVAGYLGQLGSNVLTSRWIRWRLVQERGTARARAKSNGSALIERPAFIAMAAVYRHG